MARNLKVIPQTALVFTATDTTKNFTIVGSPTTYQVYTGLAKTTIIYIPNWTNEVTAEFEVKDPNGYRLFHAAALARNQIAPPIIINWNDPTYPGADYPVHSGCVVSLTLSGVPGAGGGTAYVEIYYK